MTYTKAQLVDALVREWEYLCHDDYDPEDLTPEQYRKEMQELTIEQLIEVYGGSNVSTHTAVLTCC